MSIVKYTYPGYYSKSKCLDFKSIIINEENPEAFKNFGCRLFKYSTVEVSLNPYTENHFKHFDVMITESDRFSDSIIRNFKTEAEAIEFFKHINTLVTRRNPGSFMIAEESTAWPMVTKPSYIGGLGFNYKWNMGWMNDTLSYVSIDPYFRRDNHNKLTFSMFYAFSENFVLSVSHDEVVHGKCSLLNKMYGEYDQRFDLMRTFLMFMYGHPGKKLLFMGQEFAQAQEWSEARELDWYLLQNPDHKKIQDWMKELLHIYQKNKAMYELENRNYGLVCEYKEKAISSGHSLPSLSS